MVRAQYNLIARLCLFAMLCLQLATAASACPNELLSDLATIDMSVDMPGCGGNMDQGSLCTQHRVSNVSATKTVADRLPSPMLAALVASTVDIHAAPTKRPQLPVEWTANAVGPPAYLRFQALRL